ncbi:MAG: prepilin-type N-terminal cleavage/methylation domain-containing protein [Elusimicrobiaceae bacterium]|nr:prepilin-type N-terminal cleavage/methylation domain-containing protein [Elusimicrobiaceae bacterium]
MKKNKKAFTLIELLVVVLIIGILAAIALPQYEVAVAKSRYTQLMTLVKHVKTEQEVYRLANGHYAADCEELGVDLPGGTYLNNDKLIADNNNKFYIQCLRESVENPVAIVGIFVNSSGSLLATYEQYVETVDTDATFGCWGKKTSVYQKVCKNLCGELQDDTWCAK